MASYIQPPPFVPMTELVDVADLKSAAVLACVFDSRWGHHYFYDKVYKFGDWAISGRDVECPGESRRSS